MFNYTNHVLFTPFLFTLFSAGVSNHARIFLQLAPYFGGLKSADESPRNVRMKIMKPQFSRASNVMLVECGMCDIAKRKHIC